MRKKITRSDILQLLRFGIVGVTNTTIDFGVLNLLLWLYPTTSLSRTLEYNSLAVLLAATNSFFMNKYWTFQKRNRINSQEVFRFVVIAGATTLMNDLLMWILGIAFPAVMSSGQLGASVLKFFAIFGTMSVSFFGMRLWVFFQHRHVGGEGELQIGQERSRKETLKLPALDVVYDVTIMVGGVLKPIHEIDTVKMEAVNQPVKAESKPVQATEKPQLVAAGRDPSVEA